MKNSPVVKAIKYIAYAVGAVVALVLLLVLTLPLWLGPVVKPAVRVAVPRFTGTTFELGHLYLNPYTGRLEVGGLVVGNPKGYDEPVALSLSNLVFDAAMTTLSDEYVHVEEISIDGVFVSYLGGGEHDVDNFTQIQYNLAGSKEKFEESKNRILAVFGAAVGIQFLEEIFVFVLRGRLVHLVLHLEHHRHVLEPVDVVAEHEIAFAASGGIVVLLKIGVREKRSHAVELRTAVNLKRFTDHLGGHARLQVFVVSHLVLCQFQAVLVLLFQVVFTQFGFGLLLLHGGTEADNLLLFSVKRIGLFLSLAEHRIVGLRTQFG